MMERLRNSWDLFNTCLYVLSHDRELLLFPLLSGTALVLVLGSFAAGLFGTGMWESLRLGALSEPDTPLLTPENLPALLVAFLFYFATYLVVTFFNAGLVAAARIRLAGGDPTVRDGLAAAARRLGAIVGYCGLAATVGLLLRLLESRSRSTGRVAAGLLGMAWSLATYLVVPVLVIEGRGPLGALRRSAALLGQTWGEQIVANIGFGLLGTLLFLPGLILLALGAWLGHALGGWSAGLVLGVVLAGIYWLALAIVLSALRGIYTAALYAYATHSDVRDFPDDLLAGAFVER